MSTYSSEDAKSVIAALKSIVAGVLSDYRYEIQDGGRFLLVSTNLVPELGADELDKLCDTIKAKLVGTLPKEEKEYSWMINIKKKGRVVGSVFADLIVE